MKGSRNGGREAGANGAGPPRPVAGAPRELGPEAVAAPALSRRSLLRLMGASAALAGGVACMREPSETVYPYARRPAELVPGVPLTYATSHLRDGYAVGVVVQAREGRPIKVEGNPEHPASLGAAGVFEQAYLLDLYDPHRARGLRRDGQAVGWERLRDRFSPSVLGAGKGLAFLLEPSGSPLRADLVRRLRERLPEAGIFVHSPLAAPGEEIATRAAFGAPLVSRPSFRAARRVLSVGDDFTATGPDHLRRARDFAARRKPRPPWDDLCRLYAAESAPTPTGAIADHHLPMRDSAAPALLAAVADEIGVARPEVAALARTLDADAAGWARAAARDLAAHRGEALVRVGDHLPAAAHALGILVNGSLGAADGEGAPLAYAPPARIDLGDPSHGLGELAEALARDEIDTLAILGGNPVYTAPADLPFGELLARVPETLYLGSHENETATRCRWFVAEAHSLEAWGDAASWDGTISFVQPLIDPLWGGHTVDEMLALFAGEDHDAAQSSFVDRRGSRELLRAFWRSDRVPDRARPLREEPAWEEAIRRGFLADSALPPESAAAALEPLFGLIRAEVGRAAAAPGGMEIAFRPDPAVFDGRFATNTWLLELPDPITKLSWGNALLTAPADARRLGIEAESVVELAFDGRSLEAPVMVVPGHAEGAVTLRLGWGREGIEGPGEGVGVSAYRLRTREAGFLARGATLTPTGRRQPLASTQQHWRMEGREIAVHHTLAELRRRPEALTEHLRGPLPSLYAGPPMTAPRQWGMTIDLSLCTGCSACVVACQAENNLPVVGWEGVRMGREMYWMRVDRYLHGPEAHPHVITQPMLCQHCEQAPCEYVCPVNATVHSEDGLNEMIYNRCVGTRFCSNNCPYKVRRFNWFDYNEDRSEVESLVLNPEVTVRERGVMEKCTYCVQRIRTATIRADREGRELEDGEVATACQLACPTRAIVFGDLTDPGSAIAASREDPRRYEVLHDLGTRPRTLYLARIEHPNPELESAAVPPEKGTVEPRGEEDRLRDLEGQR